MIAVLVGPRHWWPPSAVVVEAAASAAVVVVVVVVLAAHSGTPGLAFRVKWPRLRVGYAGGLCYFAATKANINFNVATMSKVNYLC